MDITRVSIIGLGLIGGSLAKALRRSHPQLAITGMDINDDYTGEALMESAIDIIARCAKDAVKNAQIVFLCTPVGTIPQLMAEIAAYADHEMIITDTGSSKQAIMETARQVFPEDVLFIGGHPMTGTEHSGYSSALPHLFENAYYIFTPPPFVPTEKLDSLTSLLSSVGAIPIVMDADLHDHVVGSISHLPHVIAAALVNTVSEVEDPQCFKQKLAAGGFKDITRIASSNPRMWRDISMSNKKHLSDLISSTVNSLCNFNEWLKNNDSDNIESFFSTAKIFRDSLHTFQATAMTTHNELYVDIEDRPGAIGKITTLLGEHGLNIKNLRVIHSREDEPGGCLVISMPDAASVCRSMDVLGTSGYKSYKQ